MSHDADRGSPGGDGAPSGGGGSGGGGRLDQPGGSGIERPESWDLPRTADEVPKATAAATAISPHDRRPRYLFLVVGVAAVMLAMAAAAAIAWQLTDTPAPTAQPQPETQTTIAAPTPQVVTTQTPAATPSTSAVVAASADAVASSGPPAQPHDSAGQCFASLLPAGALGEPVPALEACCTGEDGYSTMLKLKAALVRVGGGGVTPAMSEWSILGWHETAAFAIMRAHCCPDAPALGVSETFSKCRMDEALAYLVNALDDEGKMTEALEAYRAAAKCLAGSGWGGSFNQYGFPHGGELVSLKRILERVGKARAR